MALPALWRPRPFKVVYDERRPRPAQARELEQERGGRMASHDSHSAVEQGVAGIPVLARPGVMERRGPAVVVLHGMSTTPEMMQAGWPDGEAADGFERVYWRLPVLREGGEALRRRRDDDLFLALFSPVWSEVRAELGKLLDALGDRPLGLFGFSIGGFLALWGALDHPQVRAAVSVGGVPNFDYLTTYYPDYAWDRESVAALRAASDLLTRVGDLARTPTLILHGLPDDVARWEWMRPLAEALAAQSQERHPHQALPDLRHRLAPQSPEEARDVAEVRRAANAWFQRWLH